MEQKNEIWKPIKGYEGIYEVSNLGRVRSLDRIYKLINGHSQTAKGRIMSQFNTKDGYKGIRLRTHTDRKTFKVHRLVALAYIPNPDNFPFVNHKDENKHNNHVDNLEWCTPKYNLNYGTVIERLSSKHYNHPKLSKPVEQLTIDGVLIQTYPSAKEAARQLGLHPQNIGQCCRGKYRHIGGYLWKFKE